MVVLLRSLENLLVVNHEIMGVIKRPAIFTLINQVSMLVIVKDNNLGCANIWMINHWNYWICVINLWRLSFLLQVFQLNTIQDEI
jgi:hypothetical protein